MSARDSSTTSDWQRVAPTVEIRRAGESFGRPLRPWPGDELVAWEHVGLGDRSLVSVYASKRRHRPRVPLDAEPAPGEELFPDSPEPGETVEVALESGLHARVPLALVPRWHLSRCTWCLRARRAMELV